MTNSRWGILSATALLAAGLASGSALARSGGGSSYGDSWVNDSVRNPRFIEPGGDADPARYRAYHYREGYHDRQSAAGYGPYRGQVRVRTYAPAPDHGY